jgi:hypothetical protein
VVSGSPCAEIVRLATRVGSDLIVMGIDQYVEPPRVGVTNVCVMQFAPCPVLLVPSHPFQMRNSEGSVLGVHIQMPLLGTLRKGAPDA